MNQYYAIIVRKNSDGYYRHLIFPIVIRLEQFKVIKYLERYESTELLPEFCHSSYPYTLDVFTIATIYLSEYI